ncbi:hypothetical protein ABT390_25975 [Streptomyces aurantiacus]|uniref:hypothetical protein n=1 Tax=Streptomyces aurantiacus TaxID=47760 RepID=UPI00331A9828
MIRASQDLAERIYPALIEVVSEEGFVETPPDFLKAERAELRSAVDRLELEGPEPVIPFAHDLLDAVRVVDEECMLETPQLQAIYRLAGGFIRLSRLFSLSGAVTLTFGEEVAENLRHAIIEQSGVREALEPLVAGNFMPVGMDVEIEKCNWDYLACGLADDLNESRAKFTRAAREYFVDDRRWSLLRILRGGNGPGRRHLPVR